jgi:hypothetical protein
MENDTGLIDDSAHWLGITAQAGLVYS